MSANCGQESEASVHLDWGRALYHVLAETIEWYPYVILHDAYLEDLPNRDIMARLYISEGTLNRTRRSALRALARLLEEREAAPA